MTDPVDTDALRGTANRIDDQRDTPLPTAWSDARDAVDGLRAAADELDRLRAVIEDAPHDFDDGLGCWGAPGQPEPCTCWKADAL